MSPTPTSAQTNALYIKRIEIISTIILAIASLLTAWSGYQASQWSRTQAISLSQAAGRRTRAVQAASLGGQERLIDLVAFTSWVEATAAKDQPRADFVRARFRSEFEPAFEAWLAARPLDNPDAPKTPFELPIYQPARLTQAAQLEAEADALFATGLDASATAGEYVRASLFVAAALFFAAISKTFEVRNLRLIVVGLSAALVLIGAFSLLPLPVA
jgi:hypothetical protein